MRNPTSFKQEPQELTPEQRISTLEEDRPVLIDKIALCDKLQLQMDFVSSQLPAIQLYIKKLEEDQEWMKQRFSTLQDQLISTVQRMQELKSQHLESVEKFSGLCKASSDSSQVAIGELRRSLQSHKEETNSRMMKFASIEYVDAQDTQTNGLRAEGHLKQEANIEEVLRQVRELKQHCDRFFDIAATKAFTTMSCASVDTVLSERLGKLEDSIKTPLQQAKDQLNAVTMDVIMLKKSQTDPQQIVDAAKQDIEHRLGLVTLDSSNACLRSQNAEQKLAYLERKIENMDLRIKKTEVK